MAKDFFCTDTEPSVATKYGVVHGIRFDGVYIYKGIKYAKAGRFQSPLAPDPWREPLNCYCYGYESPMMNDYSFDSSLYVPRVFWYQREDCQYLNVWTPSIDKNAKKAVMVWIHGGGYTFGSGNAHLAYEGSNLARFGDVVVVSVNHRLNWLGYFDMSSFADKYRNSANAGNEDLVFALKWVRENISGFGGDPDNVTVFGQSGGGYKIRDLMQTPAADGLFRRAIVQSGVGQLADEPSPEDRRGLALEVMGKLGISQNNAEEFENAPYDAVSQALKDILNPSAMTFRPVKNDWFSGDVRTVEMNEHSKDIDVIVGTNFAEFNVPAKLDGKASMSWDEARREAAKIYGSEGNADVIIDLFRKAYPEKKPFDALYVDAWFRMPTIEYTDILAQKSRASIYSYLMSFDIPISAGLPLRHSTELPFVFHNTSLIPTSNKEGYTDRIENEISGAWVAFAKTGNPNHAGLIEWPCYTASGKSIMNFSEKSNIRADFDRQLVSAVSKARQKVRGGE